MILKAINLQRLKATRLLKTEKLWSLEKEIADKRRRAVNDI
jgi:hypothetical protein